MISFSVRLRDSVLDRIKIVYYIRYMRRSNRKPRTKSRDLGIEGTTHIKNGSPYYLDTIAERKIFNRIKNDLCPGCGKGPCECKRKFVIL